MEVYSYPCANGAIAWGYKIFGDKDKNVLTYEAAGFKSKEEAEKDMAGTLAWMAEMDTSMELNEKLLQKWLAEYESTKN